MGSVGTTGFLGCEAPLVFADWFDLVTGASLGPTLILGADFADLHFFAVVVTIPCRIFRDWTGNGNGDGGCSGLDNTPPTENVFPSRTQLLLFRGRFRSRCLDGGG